MSACEWTVFYSSLYHALSSIKTWMIEALLGSSNKHQSSLFIASIIYEFKMKEKV